MSDNDNESIPLYGVQSPSSPRPNAVAKRSTNGFAIASLVLGIVWVYAVGSILAIIFGHIAKSQIKQDPSQKGNGMAIAGLVLGYAGLAFMIFLIIALIAVGSGGGPGGYIGG